MAASQQNPTINWNSTYLNEEWKKFKQHAKLVFQGLLQRASPSEKCACLLIWVGKTGRDIFNSWNLDAPDRENIDTLYTLFKNHTAPRRNSVFARYVFQERKQPGEAVEHFVTDLRNMVKDCSYEKPDEMVRGKIASGIASQAICDKLLHEGDNLNMEKAIEIAVTHKTTRQHQASMAAIGEPADNVDTITGRTAKSSSHRQHSTGPKSSMITDCRNCGGKHKRKECPALEWNVFSATKKHWAKVCMAKKRGMKDKTVHCLGGEEDDIFFFDIIASGKDN